MHPTAHKSILGLDLFRSVAILLVLFAHYTNNISFWVGYTPSWRLFLSGDVGVDLFFVLSGFLIGRLLLEIVETAASFENLWIFLIRRWLRTLPLYFVWLFFLLVLLPGHSADALQFMLMMQNFAWPMPQSDFFFSVSWSLSIEEWFYILFGTVIIGGSILATAKIAIKVGLALFLAVPFALRLLVHEYVVSPELHVSVIYRLDSIAYGVVLAMLFMRGSRLFDKPLPAFVAGVAIIAIEWSQVVPMPPWLRAGIAPNLMSIGAALCLPAMLKIRAAPVLVAKIIRAISRQSYALYIVHMTILVDIVQNRLWGPKLISTSAAVVLAIVVPFLISYISYRFFEAPILALRPKQKLDDSTEKSRSSACQLVGVASIVANAILLGITLRTSSIAAVTAQELVIAKKIANNAAVGETLEVADMPVTNERAKRVGLIESPELIGTFDTVTLGGSEKLDVGGWILDQSNADPAPSILFFNDGNYLGAILASLPRPDVFDHYKIKGQTITVGYFGSIKAKCGTIEAIVLSGKRYAQVGKRELKCH